VAIVPDIEFGGRNWETARIKEHTIQRRGVTEQYGAQGGTQQRDRGGGKNLTASLHETDITGE